jgi:hypothetical protein
LELGCMSENLAEYFLENNSPNSCSVPSP